VTVAEPSIRGLTPAALTPYNQTMNKTDLTYDLPPIQWVGDLCLPEHDDLMDADAYDRRRMERDGWATDCWDGR